MAKRRCAKVDAAIALVRQGWMPRWAAEEVGANPGSVYERLMLMQRRGETKGWFEHEHKSRNQSLIAKARSPRRKVKTKARPAVSKGWAPINPWREYRVMR